MGALIQPGRNSTPEQRLAAAIIAQAFNDRSGSEAKHSVTQDANEARSAMFFLTTTHGDMAKWRNELCSYLDLDGDVLAERVRSLLEGTLPWPDARGRVTSEEELRRWKRGAANNDKKATRARALWQDLKKRL